MGSNGDRISFYFEKEPSYTFIIFFPIKEIFPGTVNKKLSPLFWTFYGHSANDASACMMEIYYFLSKKYTTLLDWKIYY